MNTYLTARLWSPLLGEFQRLHSFGGGWSGVVGQSLGCPASLTTRFASPLSRLMFQESLCATVHAALFRDHIRHRGEWALWNHHYHKKGERRPSGTNIALCKNTFMRIQLYTQQKSHNSAVEHLPDMQKVTGSIPDILRLKTPV